MDKSRMIYCCTTCNMLPCVCIRDSSALTFHVFTCQEEGCAYACSTMSAYATHHLDAHERPLPCAIDAAIDAQMHHALDAAMAAKDTELFAVMEQAKPVTMHTHAALVGKAIAASADTTRNGHGITH